MTQLLLSCPQPTLIAILLPLRRVCHCPLGKAPRQVKKGLHVKKWLHFQTTKRQHLPHLVCSPEAFSESQPVTLGTELHPDQCTSASARHCHDSTAGGGHSSSTCLTRQGWLLGIRKAWHWQKTWRRCVGWHFVLFLLLQPHSLPLQPFFRFFFQFFQSCCLMASLFNPAVIREPGTLPQDAS